MRAIIALFALAMPTAALAPAAAQEDLTFERLNGDPDLDGAALRGLRISPDGARVTFLQASEEDAERLDLWEFDLDTGERRLLLDAPALLDGAEETLSAEEKARRERARVRSSGIVTYQWAADAKTLLIPLSGDIFLYDVEAGRARRVTETPAPELDPKLSPDGRRVAFVRDQDLWVHDLDTGAERALTTDGEGAVSNGLAEFVAQEEMGRSTGYWWSPDGARIAFQKTDESGVSLITRFEGDRDGVRVVEQRYPRAGEDNAEVSLHVVALETGRVTDLMAFGQEAYLARVDWDPNTGDLLVQRENRDQTRLDLLRVDPESGASEAVIEETGEPWINLHDDLHVLSDGRLIWSSERTGQRRIFLIDPESDDARLLTGGPGLIDNVLCVNEEAERVYFHGRGNQTRERFVFAVSFDGQSRWTTVSPTKGWHSATFAADCSRYIDLYSDVRTPPQASLHDAEGERILWLEENPLDADHPYAAFAGPDLRPFTEDDGVEIRAGKLKADNGDALDFKLMRPRECDATNACPAIVYVYGGPGVKRVSDRWGGLHHWARIFADAGYVVFWMDNRGSARRGVRFESFIHESMGTVEVVDQAVGVDYLRELPFVEDDRIGVYGWSYGGYMTLHLLAQRPDLYAAGVAGAPVTRWELYDTHYTERYMETPQENEDGYERAAVFSHLGGMKDPLLLIHGMADDNVIFDNSIELLEALQERGILFEFLAYPGEPHGLRKRTNRVHVGRSILDFFDRRLGVDRE